MTSPLTPPSWDDMTDMQQTQLALVAGDIRQDGIRAVLDWLTFGTCNPNTRQQLGARILTSSVYAQAHALGLTDCGLCGDRGCGDCDPATWDQLFVQQLAAELGDRLSPELLAMRLGVAL